LHASNACKANLFQSFQEAFRSLQSSFKRLPNISPSFQKISIDFPELGLINGLKGERRKKSMVARLTGVQRRRRLVGRSSVFVSVPPKQAKGWRHFYDRGWRPVRRTGAVSAPNLAAEGLIEREEGNAASAEHPRAMSPETEDPLDKTGRSIRRPARIRPLHKKPEPVSSPSQADGRQPFMP
jgi:hypothetical protein